METGKSTESQSRPELRPELRDFAEAMELELRHHDRGKGDTWKTVRKEYLIDCLWHEFKEYVETHKGDELVDIANFCMMLHRRF